MGPPAVGTPYGVSTQLMSLIETIVANEDLLDTAAGLTGIGWTASLLGYLAAVVGYSIAPLGNPRSLLYLACILLVTTVTLDLLNDGQSGGRE